MSFSVMWWFLKEPFIGVCGSGLLAACVLGDSFSSLADCVFR